MVRFLLLLSLTACVGTNAVTIVVPTVATVPTVPTVPSSGPACEDLSLETCEDAAGCALLLGSVLEVDDSGGLCLPDVDQQPVACASEAACPGVPVVGRASSTSTAYLFPGGCLPEGWEALDPVSECVDSVVCADVDLTDCLHAGCVTLLGRRLETADADPCVDYDTPLEPVACQEDDNAGCADLEMVASQSEGTALFLFSSSCIPDGWHPFDHAVSECPSEPIPTQ